MAAIGAIIALPTATKSFRNRQKSLGAKASHKISLRGSSKEKVGETECMSRSHGSSIGTGCIDSAGDGLDKVNINNSSSLNGGAFKLKTG